MKRERKRSRTGIIPVLILALAFMIMAVSCGSSGSESADSGSSDESSASESFGDFTATDLQGNELTQDVFADADLTMINYWGTYCGPCIDEMPELEQLDQEYDGFQIIGVVIDVAAADESDPNYGAALDIISQTGVTYPSVLPAGALAGYLESISAIPTSIFVDSEGNIVGSLVGANIEGYRRIIESNLG